MDQLAVAPGATASKTVTMEPEATALGIVALVRDPPASLAHGRPVAPGRK